MKTYLKAYLFLLVSIPYAGHTNEQQPIITVALKLNKPMPSLRVVLQTCLEIYKDLLEFEIHDDQPVHESQHVIDCLIGKLIRLYVYAHHASFAYTREATLDAQDLCYLIELIEHMNMCAKQEHVPFDVNMLISSTKELLHKTLHIKRGIE